MLFINCAINILQGVCVDGERTKRTPAGKGEETLMRIKFSCVLDNNPSLAHQAQLWAMSLIKCSGREPSDLVVHYIEGCDSRYLDRLKLLGIQLVPVKPFDSRHPPSNKLTQIESPLLADADYVVLTDCDLAFAQDISEVFTGDQIRAKIVDDANLAPSHWRAVFKAAGMGEPVLETIATNDKKPTVANFCNGGLIVLPQTMYGKVGPVWAKWNRWLLDNPKPLGRWSYYSDQVSLTLALKELGEQIDYLPDIYNFPMHKAWHCNQPESAPKVLHYHHKIDPNGYLQKTGAPAVDAAVDRINGSIGEGVRGAFHNRDFWHLRYSTRPDLGSGVGSRGHDLNVKRRLLEYVVQQLRPKSILDVGCGDLELTRTLKIEKYTGTDIAPAAIEIAKQKRPDWNFEVGDILDLDIETHDLVLCLDVTIHQPTEEIYRRFCKRLQDLAGRYLIVAGYNQPPWFTSAITFYYEPLSQTLAGEAEGCLSVLGGYRDTTALLWSRNGPPPWRDDSLHWDRRPLLRRVASRAKREVIRRFKK